MLRTDPAPRGRQARAMAWLPVVALAVYLVLTTLPHAFPDWWGPNLALVWLVSAAVTIVAARAVARHWRPAAPALRPLEVLAILAVTAMVVTDVRSAWSQPLRDLGIYLKAGEHYLSGAPVYMQHVMAAQPTDRTNYPFLYPPFTLPFFALLSLLPWPLVAAIWLAGSFALVAVGLRAIGVSARWALAALLWPPLFEGLFVGNVAVPAFALFAVGPWLGAGLVIGAVFKSYTGIAALWLVRERRFAALVAGIAAIVLATLATIPLTGVAQWEHWIAALRLYQESQPLVPALYGGGLPRYMPYPAFIVAAVAVVLVALFRGGRDGLSRMGVATVVASPSLFAHGFLVMLPAALSLEAVWLWLALGFTSIPIGPASFLAVVTIAASWIVPSMRRTAAGPEDVLHPLGPSVEPWPEWQPDRESRPRPAVPGGTAELVHGRRTEPAD